MNKLGKAIVRSRVAILIVAVILLIPAALSYLHTRVNYDILSYLPDGIDTMTGQDILVDQFGTGAFSFVVIEGMEDKDIGDMADQIEAVDHVKDVLWYGSIFDASIPKDILPDEMRDFLSNAEYDSQLMIILYDDTMASDGVMTALDTIDGMVSDKVFVSGMASVINDIRHLSMQEVPVYVFLAVALCLLVLMITMDSFAVPFFFLISIGMAVLYNLGTNFIQGEISYVTQALAAVLQLGVTMDYSIFLWHSYEENMDRFPGDKNRAMAHAISNTFVSVVGSSTTTVAGFIALCFMSFTLGLDLGVVMAKGVVFGVISCVTILPSLILVFDGVIEKTRHRVLMPDLGRVAGRVMKRKYVFLVLFLILMVPALYGYLNTDVYYDLAGTLPDSLGSRQANARMEEQYSMGATSMILADSQMPSQDAVAMINEIKELDGVKMAVSLDTVTGPMVPEEMIPDEIRENLKSGD